MAQTIITQFARNYNLPLEVTRSVADGTARDAISAGIRWIGMIVYVQSENQAYRLSAGITNSDWIITGEAIGITGTFTTVDTKTVTVTNGLITDIT